MANAQGGGWSPADNPYATAVSEAQWWRDAAKLAILRMREDGDDHRLGWFSSRQIDARQLVIALRQLITAEQLEQFALKELGMHPLVGGTLSQARKQFEDALPGIKDIRDGLMHFDDWSRGQGKFGPQRRARDAGTAPRDVARDYWSFGYDPAAGSVSFGPYIIRLDAAELAAPELCQAIYLAAHEVDKKATADLRSSTLHALTAAGISCGTGETALQVSSGSDLRIWVSMHMTAGNDDRRALSPQVVAALADAGLRLMSSSEPQAENLVERLPEGEALIVRRIV
jgi:hypothetical protein